MSWFGDVWDDFTGKGATQETNIMAATESATARAWAKQMANQSMNFSENEAIRQRAFQEEMSSTAVSRAVKDAESAGINPYYLVKGGITASTPSGGQGQGATGTPSMANFKNPGELVSGRMQTAFSVFKGIRLLNSEVEKLKGEAKKSKATGDILENLNGIIGPILKGSNLGWNQLFNLLKKSESVNLGRINVINKRR